MKNVVIVFTNNKGKYYIEQVLDSMEKAKKEWAEFDKVIDGVNDGDSWEKLQTELYEPTIPDNGQMAVIEKVD